VFDAAFVIGAVFPIGKAIDEAMRIDAVDQ